MHRYLRQMVGPLVTAGILALLLLLTYYGLPFPTPLQMYFLAVMGSAVLGGIWAGLVSGTFSLAHALWFLASPGAPLHYTDANAVHLAVLFITMPVTAIVIGLQRTHADRALQAAKREEQKFRSVTQSAADAIIIADHRGAILAWNDGARRMFGYEAAEVLGRPLSLLMPDRYRDAHAEGLARVSATGKSQLIGSTLEIHGQRKDGDEFPLELSLAMWTTEEGRFYSGIIRDISRRKRIEGALRASEARFRQLIEGSIQGVIIHRHYRPLFVNQAYAEMFGYPPEEILALDSTLRLFAPQEQRRLQAYHEARLRGEAAPQHYEYQGVKKDGSRIWVECRVRVIDWDGTRAIQGTVVDITERKLAEGALRRAHDELDLRVQERTAELAAANAALATEVAERKRIEEALRQYAGRLQSLHEIDRTIQAGQSPDIIAQSALNHIGCLIPSWQATISLFDWQAPQGVVSASIGQGPLRLPIGTRISMGAYGMADLATLQSGQAAAAADVLALVSPPEIVRTLQADGLRSYVRLPLRAQGQLIGSLDLWNDQPGAFPAEQLDIAREVADQLAIGIQQARLYEQVQRQSLDLEARVAERTAQLREINTEMEAFAYSVAHDLRAPLRAIQGFTQILQEDYASQFDTAGQEYAQRIVTATRRMDNLIDDLLAYCHLSRTDLQLQPVALVALVAEVMEQLETEFRTRAAQVQVDEPLPQIIGHPATAYQVVMNLLINAVKFVAPAVTPQVRIWGETRGEWARLWVEDNGIGIAPEFHGRIFRVFERLHNNRDYPGTGIGLAIVSKGVERMGGRVGVESEVGRGSRFWIELRRATD